MAAEPSLIGAATRKQEARQFPTFVLNFESTTVIALRLSDGDRGELLIVLQILTDEGWW
jgi:hypothetical protein